jgi:hypothetical protein
VSGERRDTSEVVLGGNLVGTAAKSFMPDRNMLDGDAMARDMRLAARDSGRSRDMLIHCLDCHVRPRCWCGAASIDTCSSVES